METAWANEASFSFPSSISTQFKYDVFLSFSGIDTRNNFTSHLLAALEQRGFRTFVDDPILNRGEYIGDALLKAIEESRISLVVLSKNYAASRWCLDELVKIMECRKTLQQLVLPIFYNVEPSDVRAQKGSLAEAFAKHEERLKESSDGRVKKWREALTEVADLSGLDLRNVANGDEARLIRKVVEVVQNKLDHVRLPVACHEVGLESRLQKLKKLLKMESDDVRIVEVWGMGGIGKTTLVSKLYNLIQHKFAGSCFLSNIRENSKKVNGLVVLQQQLLSDILSTGTHTLRNCRQGIEVIKQRAFCRKVLLILDDVDDVKQLEALAIVQSSFRPGSRIIVTTRDISSLNFLKLDAIYQAEKLDKNESLDLFSWHCFKEKHLTQDHLNLSRQLASYAGGLPLALEILGSFLRGKSIREWKSSIAMLRKFPDNEIQKILEISFDSLGKVVQELFLDMACFFIGTNRDFTVKVLEGCKTFAEIGINILADRCLIKYDYRSQLVMHDLVRDMGRDIVRQESLEDPGKRSRLWYHEDVLEVLRDGKGTELVKGLSLNITDVQVNAKPFEKMDRLGYHEKFVEVQKDSMGKMNNLWLLHLDYVHQTVDFEHASRRLLWLSWKGFPLECLPRNLSMEKLIALDLRYSSLKKVWNGNMILDKLKFLFLSHCHYLIRTPDFSGLDSLEVLLLNDCKNLVEVDESIVCLNKLCVLDMENCTNLQKLPSGILMLKSLDLLCLSGCSKLGNLALLFSSRTLPPKGVNSIGFSLTSVQASSCLKDLKLGDCSPEDEESLPSETAEISRLEELEKTPSNPQELEELNREPMEVSPTISHHFSILQRLDLSYTAINSLPRSISLLIALQKLFLRSCELLMELPPEIGELTNLEVLDLEGTEILCLPKEIAKLVNLTCLKVSFYGYANQTVIPRKVLSNLSRLNELIIDVTPYGEWWDAEVEAIIHDLSSLQELRTLKLYLPTAKLLEDLALIIPGLANFRFTVGRHEEHFISRLPHDVDEEFNNREKLEKALKYVNGNCIPNEISKVFKHANAFFLQRHWTAKSLSEFGHENMNRLKFCMVTECNEFRTIIDSVQFYQNNARSESEEFQVSDEAIILGSLEKLIIRYMKNMESIWKGPIRIGSLSNLKSLALHTCPSLTTLFTVEMLINLTNLEELIVEDCPKIESLVSPKSSGSKSDVFLQRLKKISLLELPELVSISSGLHVAPNLERMVVFYCPKLEKLSTMDASSTKLKVIKGEKEWWDTLKWYESDLSAEHEDYLARLFVPLRWDGDLMAQLTKN